MQKTNLLAARLRDILDELDDFVDDYGEPLEEANAEFEDALFALECADDDDYEETLDDLRDEFADLLETYRAFNDDEINAIADRIAGLLG